MILIGFAGGFRRSELVSIFYEDIEFVKEGVKIFVKKSKTDQSGEGMIKGIPTFQLKLLSGRIIKNWIKKKEI